MYTPNNPPIYLAAFAGCLAGLGAAGKYLTDPNPADYELQAASADAFAQQLDTTWGAASFTGLDLVEIEENCEAVWEERSPLPVAHATVPAQYTGLVNGVIALVRAGTARVVAEGVDPNAIGSGATGATGATGPSSTSLFIYRPGYVGTQANVYPDFPTLMTAYGLVTGPKTLEIDDSLISPALIPANRGPWDIDGGTITGPVRAKNQPVGRFGSGPLNVQAVCEDGCVFTNVAGFEGSLTIVSSGNDAVVTLRSGDEISISAWVGSMAGRKGSTPFFLCASGAPQVPPVLSLHERGSLGAQLGNPAVQVPGNSFTEALIVSQFNAYASFDPGCLTGTGLTAWQNFASATYNEYQGLFGVEQSMPPSQDAPYDIFDLTSRARLNFGCQTITENVTGGNTDSVPFGFGQTSITDPTQSVAIPVEDTLFLQRMFVQATGTGNPADAGKFLIVQVMQLSVSPGPTQLALFAIDAEGGAGGFRYVDVNMPCGGQLALWITPSTSATSIVSTTLSGPLSNLAFSIKT